jgi:hypothetical protein
MKVLVIGGPQGISKEQILEILKAGLVSDMVKDMEDPTPGPEIPECNCPLCLSDKEPKLMGFEGLVAGLASNFGLKDSISNPFEYSSRRIEEELLQESIDKKIQESKVQSDDKIYETFRNIFGTSDSELDLQAKVNKAIQESKNTANDVRADIQRQLFGSEPIVDVEDLSWEEDKATIDGYLDLGIQRAEHLMTGIAETWSDNAFKSNILFPVVSKLLQQDEFTKAVGTFHKKLVESSLLRSPALASKIASDVFGVASSELSDDQSVFAHQATKWLLKLVQKTAYVPSDFIGLTSYSNFMYQFIFSAVVYELESQVLN